MQTEIEEAGYNADAVRESLLNYPKIELPAVVEALDDVQHLVLCSCETLGKDEVKTLSTISLLNKQLKKLLAA